MTHTKALTMALELLAVATYHSPDLQAKRTEVIDAGLKALAQPPQEPVAKRPQNCGTGYCSCIECVMEAEQSQQKQAYKHANPLGGPAKVFDAMADAIRAGDNYSTVLRQYGFVEAQPQQEPVLKQSWKMVPVEPTKEMLDAADDGDDSYTLRNFGPGVNRVMQGPEDHYAAMLAAAPQPPQRKPLSDEDIDAIWDAVITPSNHIREFVRAIEAKLKEKND